jgi:hypothetical protein
MMMNFNDGETAMLRKWRVSVVAAALLLAGCSGDGVGPEGPSWFRASLEGEVTTSFEGTGNYSFQRDYAETPYYFTIYANGADPQLDHEVFSIRWPTTSRPSIGSYPLVPYDHTHGSATGVTAFYRWRRGDNETAPAVGEVYVAMGGTVEITHSSRSAVEGTIRFSGVQISRFGAGGGFRQDAPDRPDGAAPRIEVEGTFRAPYWAGFGTP